MRAPTLRNHYQNKTKIAAEGVLLKEGSMIHQGVSLVEQFDREIESGLRRGEQMLPRQRLRVEGVEGGQALWPDSWWEGEGRVQSTERGAGGQRVMGQCPSLRSQGWILQSSLLSQVRNVSGGGGLGAPLWICLWPYGVWGDFEIVEGCCSWVGCRCEVWSPEEGSKLRVPVCKLVIVVHA